MDYGIVGSLVCYKNDRVKLYDAINSFLCTSLNVKLYLIDNSPTNLLQDISSDKRIIYIHNPANPGFGAAHNMAIDLSMESGSKYHCIINPDISYKNEVLIPMIEYLEENPDVGMMMPEILNETGTIQYLPKLLPNLFWILRRKFKMPLNSYQDFINKYELRNVPNNLIYNAPILSGCFTVLNLKAIKEIGAYDERFFMYFEDFDLSRRMQGKYKTIYFPIVSVYHGYEGGANKSLKLFKVFILSAFKYFNKWGWVFDKERQRINKQALRQF